MPDKGNVGHDELCEGEHRPRVPTCRDLHAPHVVLRLGRRGERLGSDEGKDDTRKAHGAL